MKYSLHEVFLNEEYLLHERRKSSNQSIWYHGTTSEFLREILKKGMIPDPKRKRWDTDEDTSKASMTRISLEGSYWTQNLMTAMGSANNTVRKYGGYPIYIIAQLNQKSALQDEDNLKFQLESYMEEAFSGSVITNSIINVYIETLINEEYYNNALNSFIEKAHNFLSNNNEKSPIYRKELKEYFDSFIMRFLWYDIHSSESYKRYFISQYRYNVEKDDSYIEDEKERENKYENILKNVFDGHMNKSYWEKNLLYSIDALTKKYHDVRFKENEFSPTLRILEPVNFKGKNKIISIIGDEDYRERYKKEKSVLSIIYGDVIDDFIKQFHLRESDKPLVFIDRDGNIIYEETE